MAERLEIPFYAVNFQEEFGRIIHYFISEYTAGRTPNPCVVCNTWLKFGKLVDYADSVGARHIATGHYARLLPTPDGSLALCRGLDPGKDQSYVLWGIRPEVLARLQFPVGDYQKEEIRRIADRLGLRHVAEKPDSQEICFVPDQDHARFIRENRSPQNTSGEIVTTDGRVVGRHAGVEKFTIGQRKGLGVALGEPRYVVRIDPQSLQVVLGQKDELARRELSARGANWFFPPPQRFECQVKIRYRSPAVRPRSWRPCRAIASAWNSRKRATGWPPGRPRFAIAATRSWAAAGSTELRFPPSPFSTGGVHSSLPLNPYPSRSSEKKAITDLTVTNGA